MKQYFKFALIALTVIALASSCEKDEDNEADGGSSIPTASTSTLTYDGNNFVPNDMCELWSYGDFFDMYLWTGSLEQNYGIVKGTGDWLNIELYTQGSSPVGEYTIDSDNNEEEWSCWADLMLDVTANSDGMPQSNNNPEILSGTVKVTATSDSKTFKVEINITDENNKVLKGITTTKFRTSISN